MGGEFCFFSCSVDRFLACRARSVLKRFEPALSWVTVSEFECSIFCGFLFRVREASWDSSKIELLDVGLRNRQGTVIFECKPFMLQWLSSSFATSFYVNSLYLFFF